MAGRVSRAAVVALTVGLTACGGQETRPAGGSPTGRTEAPASGTATGRSTRPGGAAGPAETSSGAAGDGLDGGFVARVVDDFLGQVSRASARGWPSHVILGGEGLPEAVVEVLDQRARGSGDSSLLAARLTDALVRQQRLMLREPGAGAPRAAEPEEEGGDEDPDGKEVDPTREDTTAFTVQGEIRADGAVTWVEVRLFDRHKQKVLARTLLRDPPE